MTNLVNVKDKLPENESQYRVWDNAMIYDDFIAAHADPKFVMKNTGHKDSNNKFVYEKDFVEFMLPSLFNIEIKMLTIIHCKKNNEYIDFGNSKVVGNIYENPELFKTLGIISY